MSVPVAESAELRGWAERLERVVDAQCHLLRRVLILAETDSTQDAARRLSARAGDVIITGNQVAGRGRLGRSWRGGSAGIALTIVRPSEPSERYAIAAGAGAANALNALALPPEAAVRIKWPNDLYAKGRKLGGILVEQSGALACIGVGINISFREWPDDLREKAISLHELGCDASRLRVLEMLLPHLDAALQFPIDAMQHAFDALDLLAGRVITVRCGETVLTGRVQRIDPLRGLAIEEQQTGSLRFCAAALTTVLCVGENGEST